jgi:hypothetical protein
MELHLSDILVVFAGIVVVACLFAWEYFWEVGQSLFRRYVATRPAAGQPDDRNTPATAPDQGAKRNVETTFQAGGMPKRPEADAFGETAYSALAKLIDAGVLDVNETEALGIVFAVSAGGSKKYKATRAELTRALAALEEPPAATSDARSPSAEAATR